VVLDDHSVCKRLSRALQGVRVGVNCGGKFAVEGLQSVWLSNRLSNMMNACLTAKHPTIPQRMTESIMLFSMRCWDLSVPIG
jgi:hypothetical protein